MIRLALTLALLPAHPLGNFSVNQLVSLSLHRDRVEAVAIVDLAELPTLQFTPDCDSVARDLTVRVDAHRLQWTVGSSELTHQPGAAGLDTTRLACTLTAPADVVGASHVDILNSYQSDRLGWHELTARGVDVGVTGLPTSSATNDLRTYPSDLLSSPLDVRSARLSITAASTADSAAGPGPARPDFLTRLDTWWQSKVGGHLTPLVGLLAVLLAIVLGAAHAALPGHGKTVMAIYLAGRAGRRRDALWVGATVTATHTGGVLLLGLLLTTASSLAGETVLGWLGIASGALVILVGLTMLLSALRSRPALHPGSSSPDHTHAHGHSHSHGRGRWRVVGDAHHHAHTHAHLHAPANLHEPRQRRLTLTALGVAGGLVPSPSALVVLLGAIALGRTAFGILLVLAYGLGMAGTLTIAGLTLLKVRDHFRGRWHNRWSVLGRLTPAFPFATGGLVLLVGLGLAARAAALVV
jgi:ABC-type nickel/cobalt efflux system permease component RcnA